MFYQLLKPLLKTSKVLKIKRGDILYHQGDSPESIFFIEEGLIGLFHIAESGKETFLRVFSKNSILGHRSYFAQESYHASSIALTPTTVIEISKEQCLDICVNKPELLKEITKLLATNLKDAELRLAGLSDKSANMRIAESLVYLKLKYPEQTWTRKEIAEYSVSTMETVARVMTKLEEMGLIEKHGRDYKLLDTNKILNATL